MDNQQIAEVMKQGHAKMRGALAFLSDEEMSAEIVHDEWTARDVLAHVVYWHGEYLAELERILEGNATWHAIFLGEEGEEDERNHKSVASYRDMLLNDLKAAWEESYQALVTRVEGLTLEEWQRPSGAAMWTEAEGGGPVTVASLFDYEETGLSHEGEHAGDILATFG